MIKSVSTILAVALLASSGVGFAQAQVTGPAVVGSPNVPPAWYHAQVAGGTLVDGRLRAGIEHAVMAFTQYGKSLQPDDRIEIRRNGSNYTYFLLPAGASRPSTEVSIDSAGNLPQQLPLQEVSGTVIGSVSFAFYRAIEAAAKFFATDPNIYPKADRNLQNYSFLIFPHDSADYWVDVIPAPAADSHTVYVGCFNGIGQRRLYKVERVTYAVSYVLKNGSCGA